MKTLISNMTVISLLVLVSSCGSLTKKYDKNEVEKVKKVAVLSFAIYQDKPADNLGLGSLTKGVKMDSNATDSAEFKGFAESTYNQLIEKLAKKHQWQVVSLKDLKNYPAYQKLFNEKMKGVRIGGYHGDKKELVLADGVIDQDNFQGMEYSKKVELAKQLGVDAFIEFNAFQKMNQGWGLGNIMGTGDFSLTTRSNLTMYSLRSDEPIWRTQNIDGSESRNSSEIKQGTQLTKLAQIGKESAASSITELFKSIE